VPPDGHADGQSLTHWYGSQVMVEFKKFVKEGVVNFMQVH
jgi:hypothetical protein